MFMHLMTVNMITAMTIMSTNNWFMLWTMIEMNSLTMMPLITNKKFNESSIKFFIIQSISSSMMMMTQTLTMSMNNMNNKTLMMINLPLLIKMSMPPFHLWSLSIIENMNWLTTILLMTTQKLPIMTLMNNTNNQMNMMMINYSMITASMNSLNQTSLRKTLNMSSISNSTWMIIMLQNKNHWTMFALNYSTLTIMMMTMNQKNKSLSMNQNKSNTKKKVNNMMTFLNLLFLPPSPTFMPKWLTMNSMMKKNKTTLLTSLTTNIMNSMMYMKMTLKIMNNQTKNKWTKKEHYSQSMPKTISALNMLM